MSISRRNTPIGESRFGFFDWLWSAKNWPLKLLIGAAILIGGLMIDRLINVVGHIEEWTPIKVAVNLITETTLISTAALLSTLGFDVYTIPETRELGMEDFYVYVWGPCSGIEGFALITIFLSIYLWMFREEMDFPRAFILLPIGIALSWCLNVVRISTLVFIGARVSPELAVDTFHSHAGWLMFTILAVGVASATSAFGWFRKVPAEAQLTESATTRDEDAVVPPFFADPNIATIIPFIAFLFSAFVLQAFSQSPELYYPIRVLVMAGALALVFPYLKSLVWRPSALPVLAGVIVGIAWLAMTPTTTSNESELALALAGLSGTSFVIWVIARTLGTVVLVPIIEEIFFRGYILKKLDSGSLIARIAAITVSSLAFAILHQKWLAAFLAGIIFALVMLRRGRVTDAIIAHGIANGIIAAFAIASQDWSVI